jgi:hypothetical protein
MKNLTTVLGIGKWHTVLKNVLTGDDYLFFKIATILFSLLLIALQIHHAFNVPIWRDDAFFASVAKNLANGDGYKAVFFDRSYAFNVGISSGPTIILPAALLMFIFGAKIWAPSIANNILIWVLLLSIFTVSKDFFGKNRRWQFCFLALLLTVIFSMTNYYFQFGYYGIENRDRLALWHLLMGEVPAVLFIILGAFFLFSPQINNRKIALGGLMLGLALLTKTLAAIAVAVVILMFMKRIFFERKFQITKAKILQIALVVTLFILPFFLFELVKILSLGWSDYLVTQMHSAGLYKYNFRNFQLQRFFILLLKSLFSIFQVSTILVIGLVIYVATSSAKISRDKERKNYFCHALGMALIAGSCLHLFWWCGFFFNPMDRYLVIGLFCFLSGFTVLITNIEKKAWQFKAVIIFVISLMMIERDNVKEYLMFDGFQKNPRMAEQLMIRDIVSDLKKNGVQLIACSNNFELEYLLPETANFQNCTESPQNFSKDKVMLVTYYLPNKRIVSVRHDQTYADIQPLTEFAKKLCPKVFLETANYSLRWCNR